MVGLGGREPPASPLSGVRSNHLSYRPNASLPAGGASRERTEHPLLAKQVLSQLSYGPKRGRSPGHSPWNSWTQVHCADVYHSRSCALSSILKVGEPAAPSPKATFSP